MLFCFLVDGYNGCEQAKEMSRIIKASNETTACMDVSGGNTPPYVSTSSSDDDDGGDVMKYSSLTDTGTAIENARGILNSLLVCNEMYVQGKSLPQSQLSPPSLRRELALHGQKPIAAIVACADSRVAPEIVFGGGIGQVFVIRNAGNMIGDESVIASLEYAVGCLNIELVMILGHTKCGAVSAAIQGMEKNDVLGRYVNRIKQGLLDVDDVGCGVEINVKQQVKQLVEGDNLVANMSKQGKVVVIGAVYDIETGRVERIADAYQWDR